MRRFHHGTLRAVLAGVATVLLVAAAGTAFAASGAESDDLADRSFGVFVELAESGSGTLEATTAAVRRAIEASDWQLLAVHDSGVDREECGFSAHVFSIHAPEYAKAALAYGPHAAFALPLRIAVYEDEAGVHVAAADPRSLGRTIVSEEGFEQATADVVADMQDILRGVGVPTLTPYGQVRDRGLISKTMGLIAGGPFTDKIETAATVKDADLASVAKRLTSGFERLADDWRWKVRPIYQLDLSEQGVMVLGVTGAPVEERAFEIVGEGGDDARSSFACPGVAHAAAFPIEIVLVAEEDGVDVLIIDEMFRMKMYFEDAGTMKFAANMRMPGAIEDELRDKIQESLY